MDCNVRRCLQMYCCLLILRCSCILVGKCGLNLECAIVVSMEIERFVVIACLDMGCSFDSNLRFGGIDDRIQWSVREKELQDVWSYRSDSLSFGCRVLYVGRGLVVIRYLFEFAQVGGVL